MGRPRPASDRGRARRFRRASVLEQARWARYSREASSATSENWMLRRRFVAGAVVVAIVLAGIVVVRQLTDARHGASVVAASTRAAEAQVLQPGAALPSGVSLSALGPVDQWWRDFDQSRTADEVAAHLVPVLLGPDAPSAAVLAGAASKSRTLPLEAIGRTAAGHTLRVVIVTRGVRYRWRLLDARGAPLATAIAVRPDEVSTAAFAVGRNVPTGLQLQLPDRVQAFYLLLVTS